jgi:hypothetical protein
MLLVADIKIGTQYFVLRLCLTDLTQYRRMEKQLEKWVLGDPHESYSIKGRRKCRKMPLHSVVFAV